ALRVLRGLVAAGQLRPAGAAPARVGHRRPPRRRPRRGMNRQIRRLGLAGLVLFLALFIQLNNIQFLSAKRLNDNPLNTRQAVQDFSQPRGVIQTADGVVVAKSDPTNDSFQRLRSYPTGPLFAHVTGYFSFTFGSEGVERTYNKELTG